MSDWVVSPISLNSIPVPTSWVEMCQEARKWGLGVWLCFLRSDFSNLKLCNLTRRFYAGKQLKSGSWPSRPWIFHLAGVCLLSTFHFCLLKIWLTEPASRETPFSSDKGPLRGKGSLRGSGICYPLQRHEAWGRAPTSTEKGNGVVSVPLNQAAAGKHQQCRLFRDSPFRGHCFTNPKSWYLRVGWFSGARILTFLFISHAGPKEM